MSYSARLVDARPCVCSGEAHNRWEKGCSLRFDGREDKLRCYKGKALPMVIETFGRLDPAQKVLNLLAMAARSRPVLHVWRDRPRRALWFATADAALQALGRAAAPGARVSGVPAREHPDGSVFVRSRCRTFSTERRTKTPTTNTTSTTEYRIVGSFWELTSRFVSVFCTLAGSTVDRCTSVRLPALGHFTDFQREGGPWIPSSLLCVFRSPDEYRKLGFF